MSTVGKQLEPMQKKLEKVMLNVDDLISGLNNVLDKKTQEDLKVSLAELSKTMVQFHKATVGINELLDDNKGQINGIVTNFNKVSGDFSKISDSLNKADLGKTVKNLNATLAKVDGTMADLEAGKGSAGKLLKDEALYENIKDATKEMELLLEDVRLHPTRYVNVSLFGKKNKPYVAPENDSISKDKN
ncbi:hypothetical protein D3C80_744860 [compost metagenome]